MVAFHEQPTQPNYLVVDTDYANYSITYCCDERVNNLGILTREAVISDQEYQELLSLA